MFFRRSLSVLSVVVASTALATATAAAQQPPPPGSVLGLEVKRIDAASRTVEAVQHCTDAATAGKLAVFKLSESIDIAQLPRMFGASLDRSTTPPTVLQVGPTPCQVSPGAPGAQPGPGGQPKPGGPGGQPNPGAPGGQPGGGPDGTAAPGGNEVPTFDSRFLNRVWKFQGDVDGFEDGKLSYTIGKVLNLPKRMRAQDDELLDQDAIVLVGKRARVWKGTKLVSTEALGDANQALVHGKLLAPAKWQKDEDGEPTPTIRAKNVLITG